MLELAQPILDFLDRAAEPVIVAEGLEPLALTADRLSLEPRADHLLLHAWNDSRSLALRLTKLEKSTRALLRFQTRGLFGRPQRVDLADRGARPDRLTDRRAHRDVYREALRRSLARHFAGWRLQELTAGADLENSLSPAFPRALLTKGRSGWAALLATSAGDADHALTFGLIWLDYLRRRERRRAVEGLALFVPQSRYINTALRLKHLNRTLFQTLLFAYDEQGFEELVDLRDWGNLYTALDRPWETASDLRPAAAPEKQLERQVKANLTAIGPGLREPVYGQVPAFAATDRDLLDLLAADAHGRLAVLELKTQEDIHLPVQALDYWLRVHWHQQRNDFLAHGYFPGVPLVSKPPRLYFVAPALRFHPSNDTVLRYFSPEIEAERVGVAEDWRWHLRVVHRQAVGGVRQTENDQNPHPGSAGGGQSQPPRGAGAG